MCLNLKEILRVFDNYPIKLSDTTKPFLKGLKTAPAILLIHGYTGSPRDKDLARASAK